MIKRVLVFLGWSLSTFLMLVGFTGFIENPLMSIAVILWGLITFPPILKRTKKYGRTWNITGRIFTFILSLVIAGQAPQPVKTASEQVKAPQPSIAAKTKVIPSVEPSVVAPPTVSVSPSPDANIASEDSETTPNSDGQSKNSQIRTTKSGYYAASTKEDLDQAIGYAAQQDEVALNKLIASNRVFQMKEGLKVYIENCEGLMCSIVKIRVVGQEATAYTVSESISK